MSFSKLSLLGAAAALAFSGLTAHADSLSLGNSGQSLSFTFFGNHESGSGGNYSPSSANIGGKALISTQSTASISTISSVTTASTTTSPSPPTASSMEAP